MQVDEFFSTQHNFEMMFYIIATQSINIISHHSLNNNTSTQQIISRNNLIKISNDIFESMKIYNIEISYSCYAVLAIIWIKI